MKILSIITYIFGVILGAVSIIVVLTASINMILPAALGGALCIGGEVLYCVAEKREHDEKYITYYKNPNDYITSKHGKRVRKIG